MKIAKVQGNNNDKIIFNKVNNENTKNTPILKKQDMNLENKNQKIKFLIRRGNSNQDEIPRISNKIQINNFTSFFNILYFS